MAYLTVQADQTEEEDGMEDVHSMVLAGLQYSLLAERDEAAEEAAVAAAEAHEAIQRLEQVCFCCASLTLALNTAPC